MPRNRLHFEGIRFVPDNVTTTARAMWATFIDSLYLLKLVSIKKWTVQYACIEAMSKLKPQVQLFFVLRQNVDTPTPKHRRQLTTWQVCVK